MFLNDKEIRDYLHARLKGCGTWVDFAAVLNIAVRRYGGVEGFFKCQEELSKEFVEKGYSLLDRYTSPVNGEREI